MPKPNPDDFMSNPQPNWFVCVLVIQSLDAHHVKSKKKSFVLNCFGCEIIYVYLVICFPGYIDQL